MNRGEKVLFHPDKGKPMEAVVGVVLGNGTVELTIGSDPFPVLVNQSQVSGCDENGKDVGSQKVRKVRAGKKGTRHSQMASTAEKQKPSAKELRTQAQGLGIKGWEDMSRKELAKAIRKAEKSTNGHKPTKAKPAKTTTKAKSKATSKPKASTTKPKATKTAKAESKASANDGITIAKSHPKATPEAGVNPFRKNSSLHRVAKLLLKGGTRRALATKLASQVELHPYQKASKDVDLNDYDKRLLLGSQTMRDEYGYGVLREGRGLDGKILVFIPGGPNDPRSKKTKASKKK